MKCLIIGGTGFVGTYLARYLQTLGYETAVTKMPGELVQNPVSGAAVYELDILDRESVMRLLKEVEADQIFHLAAQSSVAISWKNPGLTIDVNIKGSTNVLEAVRESGRKTRILLVGSSEEYGSICPQEIPVQECTMVRPGNIYAATKACQNMIGGIYAKAYGMDVVMVRAFNHIGPNQEPVFAAADFCRQVARIEAGQQEAVIRTGNLDVERDFTDVRDVVRAYAMLAESGQAGETYNVGSGQARSIREIVQMVSKQSFADIRVETDPEKLRPVDVPHMRADIRKMQKITGWTPQISLEQTIQEMLDYWRVRCRKDVS